VRENFANLRSPDKQDRRRALPALSFSHPTTTSTLSLSPSIFLIDGTALIYRAHYAFAASGATLTSAAGEDTTIAVGFVNVRGRSLFLFFFFFFFFDGKEGESAPAEKKKTTNLSQQTTNKKKTKNHPDPHPPAGGDAAAHPHRRRL
jgi:hypothetical protein